MSTDNPRASAVTVASKLARMPLATRLTVTGSLLVLPAAALLFDRTGLALAPLARHAFTWGVAAVVVGVALGVEDRSLASLGVRRPAWRDLGYLLGTAVLMLAAVTVTDPIVRALGLGLRSGTATVDTGGGLGVALFGAVTTGVVEELLYRGYAVERLVEYSESAAVAGTVTVGAFTAAHLVVWPLGNVLTVAVGTTVLTVVYLRRRTLFPVVGAHVGVWVVAVLGQVYG